MKINKIAIVCLLALFPLVLASQTVVEYYDGNSSAASGVVYALPAMDLKVVVTAECVVERQGPFYQYADRFLSEKNRTVVEDSKVWHLKKIEVLPSPRPDLSRTYQVLPNSKGFIPGVQLTADGIIAGVNASDIVVPFPKRVSSSCAEVESDEDVAFGFDALGGDVLMASSIPSMAEMTAKQIYAIRESRTALLACDMDVMPDGRAVEAILERLDMEEAELMALFIGKRTSFVETKEYTISPDDDLTDMVVCRMSSVMGIVDADNLIGEPIYLSLKGTYRLEPSVTEKKQPHGFAYIVPGEALVNLYDNKSLSLSFSVPMPQFGYVAVLNENIVAGNRTKILFNPEIGTIMQVIQ